MRWLAGWLAAVLLRMHIDRLERVINMDDLDRHRPQPAQLLRALLVPQTGRKFCISAVPYLLRSNTSVAMFPQLAVVTGHRLFHLKILS